MFSCDAAPLLNQRPEGTPLKLVAGKYDGTAPANWPLLFQGDYVTLQGQGYFGLAWQIEYWSEPGVITPPIFTAVSGTWLHVGGGGGHNLGDPQPGTTGTWLGNTVQGLSQMASGEPTPWAEEFYYVDGELTVTENETDGLYNITVAPKTYSEVSTSVMQVHDIRAGCGD